MIADNVNHPKHYANGMSVDVECIMFTRCLSFDLGNAFKYVWRSGEKVTESLDTDLRKALWYLKDASEYCELNDRQYNSSAEALVSFLPKKQLPEWKYKALSCILMNQLKVAMMIIRSGLDDTDTAS
jgi:hypothetical protein